jgi:hypothetical protein
VLRRRQVRLKNQSKGNIMKYLLFAATLAASIAPALATDTNISLSIGQPELYGRIEIADYPPPRVVYRNPISVGHVADGRTPLYLHVPRSHYKSWRKNCSRYDACNERVYFVQDYWYVHEYVPRYQKIQHDRHEEHINHDGRSNELGVDLNNQIDGVRLD